MAVKNVATYHFFLESLRTSHIVISIVARSGKVISHMTWPHKKHES